MNILSVVVSKFVTSMITMTIVTSRFGRRAAILADCVPLSLGWLLTWQARSLTHLYIARTITGIGIGVLTNQRPDLESSDH